MIDKIRMFPMVDATGYPDKTDATTRRIEKHQEEYRALVQANKADQEIEELLMDLYNKKAEQQRLRMEIFNNRKLDIYV
jgi:Spy/CpxP family protein refolding chaperone